MDSQEIINFQTQVKAAQAAILHFENLPDDSAMAFSGGSALAKSDAENTLAQPVVKERICAALKSISDDLDKITEKTTESLLGMLAVGTLVITQNPFLYAWIGLLVYRATVKGFCIEFQKNSEAGKK
jgi:chaperonin cofactor prefoldin